MKKIIIVFILGLLGVLYAIISNQSFTITQTLNLPFKLGEKFKADDFGEYERLNHFFESDDKVLNYYKHIVRYTPLKNDLSDNLFDFYIVYYQADTIIEMIVGYRVFESKQECEAQKEKIDTRVTSINDVDTSEPVNTSFVAKTGNEYYISFCDENFLKKENMKYLSEADYPWNGNGFTHTIYFTVDNGYFE